MMIEQFNGAIESYIRLWYNSSETPLGEKHSFFKRSMSYYRIKNRLNRLGKRLCKNAPQSIEQMKDDPELIQLVSMWLEFDVSGMSESLRGDYIEATDLFVKRVKSKWPNMSTEDIFQALRNVWIMIAIQIMSDLPVTLTDAMFAYSMLYPLTDNLLDDANKTFEQKSSFNTQLYKRLRGAEVHPNDLQEKDVFEMIELIENQYPRAIYPDVYESMLLIQDAQVRSLNQQYASLSDAQILRLSFEKGAASVLADGFLVLGNLNTQQFNFLTGYGIVLQLADDLQDIDSDKEHAHITLFSSEKSAEQLSVVTHKLISLSKETLTFLPCDNQTLKIQLTTLLDKSLSYLISDAIFVHKKKMPRQFIRRMNATHLMGFYHYKRLKKISAKWVNALKNQYT